MITYKQFVIEGGNIKVKTEKGEVAAAPFAVTDKNRKSRQTDIKNALSDLHDSFHKETGEHLFGKNKKALNSHSLFAGSTKDLMDSKISHGEFAKHKPKTGDIDVQFPKEHAEKLEKHLTPGKKLGKYTVVGTKKHGNEISAVMKHENGEHHQFDFEKTHYEHEEPTKAEQFLHSSNWEDTKKGIKGVHHKILINAAGGTAHKFSITHGLRSRTDESDPGTGNPEHVSRKLFGPKADHSKIHSFGGVAELIKKHIPAHRHQEIYDKFKSDVQPKKDADHGPALEHLRNTLGVKDTIKEEAEEELDEGDEELEDSYSMEAGDEEIGGDATDEFGADVGAEVGGEEEHEASEDQAIYDIKNAIEELEEAHWVKQYVIGRRIPRDKFSLLYYSPDFKKFVEEMGSPKAKELMTGDPRLIIPFFDVDGNLFAFQGRALTNSKVRYISIKLNTDASLIYGLDRVNLDSPVYVVEGPIDSLFLPNAIAAAGSDLTRVTDIVPNPIFVFDNEPRNKEICRGMAKAMSKENKIVIWPDSLSEKDINDMVLIGKDPEKIIRENTYEGLEAGARLAFWRKS